MTKRINFEEPIPQMIERLKTEHIVFESELVKIEDNVNRNDIKQAAETVRGMSDRIIQHAVEEEARLMRVIMHNAKAESSDSVEIMQEHNWVLTFLKDRLVTIKDASVSTDSVKHEQAKKDLNEFVCNLRKHFKEEEQIVFPLAMKSQSAS